MSKVLVSCRLDGGAAVFLRQGWRFLDFAPGISFSQDKTKDTW